MLVAFIPFVKSYVIAEDRSSGDSEFSFGSFLCDLYLRLLGLLLLFDTRIGGPPAGLPILQG